MSYKLISKKELPKSVLEMEIELPWADVAAYENAVLKEFNVNLEIPGFRKGHIPETILREKVGDMRIVEEMADLALNKVYGEILEKEKLNTIGRPSVVITKIARNNPVEVRVTTALVPKATLPDYKKLAVSVPTEKAEVTDEEVEKFIEEIRKNYARSQHSYGEHDHNNEHAHNDKNLVLPEVNDEFVKKLGKFENVDLFKKQIKENLTADKEHKTREKRRLSIIEKIVVDTKVEIPEILVESELDRMIGRFESDIARSGLKIDDYLKHIKKTKDDMRKDWRNDAEKQAAMHIVLAEIAIKEKIEPKEEKVKEQYDMILSQHTDADPMRVKLYVEEQMTMGMVFDYLEELK
jgi:FKBP-type peptidyl-prolyl cis-trans isomerase (trigger factor)